VHEFVVLRIGAHRNFLDFFISVQQGQQGFEGKIHKKRLSRKDRAFGSLMEINIRLLMHIDKE